LKEKFQVYFICKIKPNEVILTLTNRCEFDLNVAFISCQDTNSVDMLNRFDVNAQIKFGSSSETDFIQIDRLDNSSRTQTTSLRATDLQTNGFVCFRRDNKIGISCHVQPICDQLDLQSSRNVRICFDLKYIPANVDPAKQQAVKAALSSPASDSASPDVYESSTLTPVIQRVFIDFGKLLVEHGAKMIRKPEFK
jgi:hypothetical protein